MRRASSTRRQVGLAWAAVALCIAMIGMFSGAAFASEETSRFMRPLLHWLWPDLEWRTARAISLGVRKTAHFVEYAALALLTCRAIWLSIETSLGRLAAFALAIVLFVASADETHQAFTPTRGGSAWDVALDVSGGLAAIFLFIALRRASRSVGEAPPARG